MTHLSVEALLSLREPGAEPGAASARAHVDQCPQCQAELDRLHQRVARLKALPSLRPARDHWPETAARFRAERLRRRTRTAGLLALAIAASIAIVTGSLSTPDTSLAPTSTRISQAMERSRALEGALSAFNPDARMLDGRTAGMAQELE